MGQTGALLAVLGLILLMVARIRACNHGGRIAKALDSEYVLLRALARAFSIFILVVGAIMLLIAVWPVIALLVVIYIIVKIFR
jgi:hypothetical protein